MSQQFLRNKIAAISIFYKKGNIDFPTQNILKYQKMFKKKIVYIVNLTNRSLTSLDLN